MLCHGVSRASTKLGNREPSPGSLYLTLLDARQGFAGWGKGEAISLAFRAHQVASARTLVLCSTGIISSLHLLAKQRRNSGLPTGPVLDTPSFQACCHTVTLLLRLPLHTRQIKPSRWVGQASFHNHYSASSRDTQVSQHVDGHASRIL